MKTLLLGAALALSAPAAMAFDPAAMTPAEREAFGAAVREYLLANPGLVYEMLGTIEAQRMDEAASADRETISKWGDELFRRPGDAILGNPQGDVTLVMFTDYRCPYCRATEADIAALVATDPGLRVVVKHYAVLTPESAIAAAFALAVTDLGGSEAHAAAHARLFTLRGGYTDATLARLAEEIGLRPDAVLARMKSDDVQARVDSTVALGRELGFDATPSFVLPDLLVRGQMPKDVLASYIEEARAKAD